MKVEDEICFKLWINIFKLDKKILEDTMTEIIEETKKLFNFHHPQRYL